MSHADSPGVDEILAYREIVSTDTPFAAFSDPRTRVSLRPRLEDLVAVSIVFTPDDTEDVAHAQMAIERPTAGREVIVPAFMAEYDRVVTPLQDEVVALSDDERAALNVDAAHAARQVLAEGRRTLAAFALFSAGGDSQHGRLLVPRPMMGNSGQSQVLAPQIAAHILPRAEVVNQRW